ncbi:MAG TPA: cyclic nucleotide-binding domain-containing protein [Gammaproteobacteria bacterium]|nr:cyclic nucleotide-binding domain-containing protein [Gammaproteobacteria bacterium]
MGAASQLIDPGHISQLTPLNRLTPPLLDEALARASIERHPPGRRLFMHNERDDRTLFLLSGQLVLYNDDGASITLKAESSEARQPVDDTSPHRYTALASTSVSLLSLDAAFLRELLQRNDTAPPGEDTHINAALTAPLFSRLPKPHLQVLKKRLVHQEANAGEDIVREGTPAEYYYLVTAGRCRVSRRNGKGGTPTPQYELSPGDGFGEGALITGKAYDTTVTMIEKGALLRLSRGEFLTLLVRPFIKWISFEQVMAQQRRGAILLDIRSTGAFQKRHIAGSVNIPLMTLHHCAPLLNKARTYILCGDGGKRTASAAFLLARQGMDTCILDTEVRSVHAG